MIRIEREARTDEIASRKLDHSITDIMLERGYTAGHTGVENGYRFLEFDGGHSQELRDFNNAIIADILAIRHPGIWFTIGYRPSFSIVP